MRKQLKELIKISRPRFWIYLAGPYLIGYIIGTQNIYSLSSPHFIYLFILFLIPANIFLYAINDYYDQDTDKFNIKKTSKETKTTSKNNNFYKNIILISFLCFIPAYFLLNQKASLLFSIFIFLSYAYSAIPFRFKSKPFIDSASNILYAIPGFIGFTQISDNYPPLLIVILTFLWTFSMHLFSAVPDINSDIKANLKTTAVFLGYKKSLILCFIFWGILSLFLIYFSPIFIISLIYPFMAFLGIYLGQEKIEKLYWYFPYINIILGFILFLYCVYIFIW